MTTFIPDTLCGFFFAALQGMRNFSDQGSNLRPLQWKCRVLTSGPPGKSPATLVFKHLIKHAKAMYKIYIKYF